MKRTITRVCPKCKNGILLSETLDKASWDHPALCSHCGKGFVRWNIFYWPVLPLIDGSLLFAGWLIVGAKGVLAAFVLGVFLYFLFKLSRLNEKYGLLVRSPNDDA